MKFIYRITNLVNGKVYIGQTDNLERRWGQHYSSAKCFDDLEDNIMDKMVITRSMIKHGPDNFTFEVIASCLPHLTDDDVDDLEGDIMIQYNSLDGDVGYNIELGGKSSPRTPAILAKISASLLKYYETHDGWNKGGTLTEEWKGKISQSHMGLVGTNTGRVFSDEWVANMSKSMSGKGRKSTRKFSEEAEYEMCMMYAEDGASTRHIGDMYGCAATTVTAILLRNDIDIRHSGQSNGRNLFTKEQELDICEIYKKGKTSKSRIAKQFSCGGNTIRDILLRHNVKL